MSKSRKKAARVAEQAMLEAQEAIGIAIGLLGAGDVMGAHLHADEAHQLAQKAARELDTLVGGPG